MPRLLTFCLCLAASSAIAEEHHDHVAEAADVRILHAWTNAGNGGEARVYMEIENTGSVTQTLTGGESERAGDVSLVASAIRASGVAEPVAAIPVGPGDELALGPDGLYLLLNEFEGPLARDETFPLEVHFDPAGHVEVEVQVEAADATAHSHAGHPH